MMNTYLIGKGDAKNHIVYDGNSFWASPYTVPDTITTQLGGEGVNYDTVNVGISSASIGVHSGSTNYLLYDVDTQVLPYKNDNRVKDIVCVFEGINDLYFQLIDGATNAVAAANTLANYHSYITKIVNKGFHLVINTLTPRNNVGTPAGYEAARQIVNTALRAVFPNGTGVVGVTSSTQYQMALLVDVGADLNFGQAGQTSNTDYYQTDLVHPTTTMGSLMASRYYVPAINSI